MVAGSRSGSQTRGHTQLPSVPLWGGQGGNVSPSPSRGGGWPARSMYMEALS